MRGVSFALALSFVIHRRAPFLARHLGATAPMGAAPACGAMLQHDQLALDLHVDSGAIHAELVARRMHTATTYFCRSGPRSAQRPTGNTPFSIVKPFQFSLHE